MTETKSVAVISTQNENQTSRSRVRRDLTLQQKLNLLQRYDELPECSQRRAAQQLCVSQPLLCKLLQARTELMAADVEGHGNRIRQRSGKDLVVENALAVWAKTARKQGLHLNRRLLINAAKNFATQAGRTDFQPTDGWLSRWKRRYNLDLSNNKNIDESVQYDSFVCDYYEQHKQVNSDNVIQKQNNEIVKTKDDLLIGCNLENIKDEDINDPIERINEIVYDKPSYEETRNALSILFRALSSNATSEDMINFNNMERTIDRIYNVL